MATVKDHNLEESEEQRDMTVACLKEIVGVIGSGKYNQLAVVNALMTAVNNCVYEMNIEKQHYLHRMEVMYDMLQAVKEQNRSPSQ